MRIATIGSGQMARALGTGWARAGHEVMIGGRSPEKAGVLAEQIGYGARSGGLREAVEFGEVVLLAVNYAGLFDALEQVELADRTVIDCNNALVLPGVTLAEEALAEHIAQVTEAKVVKAFNLCAAEVWEGGGREFEGRALGVPMCGDDEEAMGTVSGLVKDLGLHPIPSGGLNRARYLEGMAAFAIGLWFNGHDVRAMLPPLEGAFGA